jgi:hypothetical protein
MNDSVLDGCHAAVVAEFDDSFMLTAEGTEGHPLHDDYFIRFLQTGVHASDLAPAVVINITENAQRYLVGLDSRALAVAMERLGAIARESWDARLELPYDRAIRGIEACVTPSRLMTR